MTFFTGNLTSYIFIFNFFSVSRLGIKLREVIGKKPVFWAQMGILGDKYQSYFGYVVQEVVI